ncbi:class I SAM-dependent methyltransferase [Streptomyces sp. NPDC090106]|uniref:class I SAM-dependent methyltransferase n=1 Tax=Streptomyces sp. NPDC090106 TaxID=3365946 RepID=UPI0038192FA7
MKADHPDFIRATATSYDAIAGDYTARFSDWAGVPTFDRALIDGFAALVRERGREPVADVGSGPGTVTARMHGLGVPVFGVDVSPGMVALARRNHPALRFHVGSMTSLDLPDATLGGVLALYSVIHVPDEALAGVFAEFRRVLVPGGYLLLAFQLGDGERTTHLHLAERFGHPVSLDYYLRSPEPVTALLAEAGLALHSTVVREPEGEEKRGRVFVLARRAGRD